MYGAPRSEKSQTITRVTIPTAKSNYEVSPTVVRICVCVCACIYIYIHPSPPPPLCTCKYANIRFRIFGKLREESLPYKTKNQLKILSALTVHARCNTVPELINRDSRRTKTG